MIKIPQEKRRNRAGLWLLVLGLEGWMPKWRKEYSTLYSGSIQDPERRNRTEAQVGRMNSPKPGRLG